MEPATLEFKTDGIYLDGRKINFVKNFDLHFDPDSTTGYDTYLEIKLPVKLVRN